MDDKREPLTDFADIIKVDVRNTTPEAAHRAGQALRALALPHAGRESGNPRRIPGRQESGFCLLSGIFLSPAGDREDPCCPRQPAQLHQMLQVVSKPELEPREIENAIKGEASLCYRLLRYMNSANFGFANEIHSVRHALSILGEREVRRWVRLVVTLAAGQNKSSDLVLSALVRARFCELLSPKIKHGESDLFLLGLLSLMDSILELPMTEVLEKVPHRSGDQKRAAGRRAAICVRSTISCWRRNPETGRAARNSPNRSSCAESEVAEDHWQAMQWARQMSGTAVSHLAPR